MGDTQPLGFYDSDRMGWASGVGYDHDKFAGEFLIGDFTAEEGGGTGERGEFNIVLHDFHSQGDHRGLSPRLQAFGDGRPALEEFIRRGGLDVLSSVPDRRAFTKRLLECGFVDCSREPSPLATHEIEEAEDHARIGEVDGDGLVYMGEGEWRRPDGLARHE